MAAQERQKQQQGRAKTAGKPAAAPAKGVRRGFGRYGEHGPLPTGKIPAGETRFAIEMFALQPKRLGEWVQTLDLPPPEDGALVADAEDFCVSVAVGAASDAEEEAKRVEEETGERPDPGSVPQPPRISPMLQPILPNLMAGIGAVIGGRRYTRLPEFCGLTWTQINIAAKADKRGFGVFFNAALKERVARREESYRDELDDRIREGTGRAFVVRKGRDNDEIQIEKVQNDTLLARALDSADARHEAALSRAAAEAVAAGAAAGGVTNIGTVYNVQVPSFLAPAGAAPKTIPVQAEPV